MRRWCGGVPVGTRRGRVAAITIRSLLGSRSFATVRPGSAVPSIEHVNQQPLGHGELTRLVGGRPLDPSHGTHVLPLEPEPRDRPSDHRAVPRRLHHRRGRGGRGLPSRGPARKPPSDRMGDCRVSAADYRHRLHGARLAKTARPALVKLDGRPHGSPWSRRAIGSYAAQARVPLPLGSCQLTHPSGSNFSTTPTARRIRRRSRS